jgi:hypothetical protein
MTVRHGCARTMRRQSSNTTSHCAGPRARTQRELLDDPLEALTTPRISPDRLAVARVDAGLKKLALEIVFSSEGRPQGVILAEIEAIRTGRRRLAADPEGVGCH